MAVGTNAKSYCGRAFQAFIFNAANEPAFASSKTDRKKTCNKKMELLDKELLLFFYVCSKKPATLYEHFLINMKLKSRRDKDYGILVA